MKLTDENGGEWEIVETFRDHRIIRKLEPPKAKPMPELRAGYLVENKMGVAHVIRIVHYNSSCGTWSIYNDKMNIDSICNDHIVTVYNEVARKIWSREP